MLSQHQDNMEATALCICLMLNVLLLRAARAHRSRALRRDAAFPQIFPSRLQFFEYESISFTCEESEWRGVRNTEELIPTCTGGTVTPAVTCTITDVFERDSGGYWCEAEGGQRSNTVNITVTAGSVILESPAPPVMEGDTVVLRCRQKATLVNRTAGFYKDGLRIETGYKGTMTINGVSRSDEGLYKCNISGAGDSPESWLTVIQNDFTQQNQEVSDADVRIVPSRLQLFEYESVSFTCRGFNLSAGWSVRNIKRVIPTCLTSVTCTLNYAFVSDSGEYWCEGAGGERSSTVNITVTGGSVILESPVLPVMEGEAVTLRCRNRATSSNLTADFYKDGLFIGSSSTGNMTIASVSKFDGGLYTCSISGAGESPASRLTVRAAHREACPLSDHSHVLVLGRTVLTVVMVALLLLLLGLLHCGKLGGTHKKKPSTY